MFIQTKCVLSVLALVAILATGVAGCASDLGECPTDATAAAQQQAGNDIVKAKCAAAGCHNSPNPANGLDFSPESVVKTQAAAMYAEAESGAMPPSGALTATEIEALRVYLACTQ
jgi:hypothetical protein